MTTKLNVGIIGCGGIALNKHCPSLAQLEHVWLTAFCDTTYAKAEQMAKAFGTADAVICTDYRQLLSDPALDVVHVCTSNDSHAEITIAFLEAGKHVMCEKPMAKTAADARRMVAAAKRSGKKLSIGYNNRFRTDSQQLYRRCRSDELGEIYFAKAHAIRRRGVPTRGAFLDQDKQGGGALIDIGTHALDLALWMMDNYRPKMVVGTTYHKLSQIEEIAQSGGWDPQDFTVEEAAFGMIVMENGATVVLESSWALNILQEGTGKVTLCGTRGGADMWDGLRVNGEEYGKLYEKHIQLEGNSIPSFEVARQGAVEREAKQWIDAILYDREPVVTSEQALVVSEILEAIYQSAETGEAVSFK